MDRFWTLLEKSTLVSGTIALGVVGAIIYLACTNQPIPDLLSNAALIIIGFFFGAKTQGMGQQAVERMAYNAQAKR